MHLSGCLFAFYVWEDMQADFTAAEHSNPSDKNRARLMALWLVPSPRARA